MAFSNSSSEDCSLHNNSSSTDDSSDSEFPALPQKVKRSCSLRLSNLDLDDSTEDEELIPKLASRSNISKRYVICSINSFSINTFFFYRIIINCLKKKVESAASSA